MIRLLPAALLELAARLARPTLPALGARHDPLGIELVCDLRIGDRLRNLRLAAGPLLARCLLVGAAKELRSPFPGAQLLGQLIPARLPIQLVLGLVDRLRLRQDLPRDLVKPQRRLTTRVACHPRPIDRDHPRPH